jgi:hypothetical protein
MFKDMEQHDPQGRARGTVCLEDEMQIEWRKENKKPACENWILTKRWGQS